MSKEKFTKGKQAIKSGNSNVSVAEGFNKAKDKASTSVILEALRKRGVDLPVVIGLEKKMANKAA